MLRKCLLQIVLVCILNHSPKSSSDAKTCTFKVEDESSRYLKKWLKITNGMVAHLNIQFRNNKTSNATKDVIFPHQWLWTFVPPGGGYFYITWPVDYFVYSFGLLDTQTLCKNVTLYVTTYPKDCIITFGKHDTVKALSHALQNMSIAYEFSEMNALYFYSYWCYLGTNAHFNDQNRINLVRYIGVPLQFFGYTCCHGKTNQNLSMVCRNQDTQYWNPYQLFPFFIGIIFFIYFPVALVKFGHCAMASGTEDTLGKGEYTVLLNEDDNYIFLKRKGPIRVSRIFLGLFGLAEKHPMLASRIRRSLFVFCSPVIVYVFILMYYKEGKDLIEEIVRHKIPYGFVTMLGGFHESMDLYLPMFGGPAISMVLYIVSGLIVQLISHDNGKVLEMGLPPDKRHFSILLKLDIETIEAFAKKECQCFKGYRKVFCVLRANIYMLINPHFWKFVMLFQMKRGKSIIDTLCPCCFGKISRIVMCLPILILYIPLCIIETLLVCIYFGLPICFFLVCALYGFTKTFHRIETRKTPPLCVLSFTFHMIFILHIYLLIMITLESFNIIGNFIFFIYLSLVIFPARSFGFVYYVIMFILYVNSVTGHFGQEYKDLLRYTIKASIKLQRAKFAARFLSEKGESSNASHTLKVIAMANIVPVEMTSSVSIQRSNQDDYVIYDRQIPGVRKDLFHYVVERYNPVHISFFHMIVQIVVVQILVLASIVFITTYLKNTDTMEGNDVLNVMSVVIVTMIPNLLRVFFIQTHDNKIRKRKVRQRVMEFWKEQRVFD